MAQFIGIDAGQTREGQAGATRHRVRLAVDAKGRVAEIGDRRVDLDRHTIVVWHQGDARSWWGLRDVESLKTELPTRAARWEGPSIVEESSSGREHIAAAVIRLDSGQAVGIVTSGYDGRSGWHLLVFEHEESEWGIRCRYSGHPRDWRAMHAPVEKLGGDA